MAKNQKQDHRGALKHSLSREEKVEMLFKHLQNLGPEGAQYSKDDVKRWFESNALSKVMINGRCMSDVFGDCLHYQTYSKQTNNHGQSDALDSSDQSLYERPSELIKGSVGGIDRTSSSIMSNVEFVDMASRLNVPSVAESLSSTRTVSYSGYSCGPPSTVPKLATGQARVLRGRSNGSIAEPADTVRSAVKSTSSSSGYPFLSNLPADECEQDIWLNSQFGGIQNLDILFPIPTDRDNELLDMKPLRIPTDEKWLESYLLQFGDGKPLQPVGPHHPVIAALEPIRYQHTFIKRPRETSELVPQ